TRGHKTGKEAMSDRWEKRPPNFASRRRQCSKAQPPWPRETRLGYGRSDWWCLRENTDRPIPVCGGQTPRREQEERRLRLASSIDRACGRAPNPSRESGPAHSAHEKVVRKSPGPPAYRFWIARALEQEKALSAWRRSSPQTVRTIRSCDR